MSEEKSLTLNLDVETVKKIITLCEDENKGIRVTALYMRAEFARLIGTQVVQLCKNNDDMMGYPSIQPSLKLELLEDKSADAIFETTIEKLYFHLEDEDLISLSALDIVGYVLQLVEDKEKIQKLAFKILKKMPESFQKLYQFSRFLLHVSTNTCTQLIKTIPNKQKGVAEIIRRLFHLFEKKEVKIPSFSLAIDLAKLVENENEAEYIINEIRTKIILQDTKTIVELIDKIVQLIEEMRDKGQAQLVAIKIWKQILLLDFNDDGCDVDFNENYREAHIKLINLIPENSRVIESIGKFEFPSQDKALVLGVMAELIKLYQAQITNEAIETVALGFVNRPKGPEDFIESIRPFLTVNQLIKYLNHENNDFKYGLSVSIRNSLETLIKVLELLDEIAINFQKWTFKDIISKASVLEGSSILKEIEKIKCDKKTLDLVNLAEWKQNLIAQHMKRSDFQSYELLFLTLTILENESLSVANNTLSQCAKKTLDSIGYLTNEGLEWFNKHFDFLMQLSPHAEIYAKNLYSLILEDYSITPLEKELIVKFTNYGLTASITRFGEIMFMGNLYKIKDKDANPILEEIILEVIQGGQDILANQYKTNYNRPIFKMESEEGMTEAAIDIPEVQSVIDAGYTLNSDQWLLTSLKNQRIKKEIFILEKRDVFGYQVICRLGQQQLLRLHPKQQIDSDSFWPENLFGKYKGYVFEGQQNILEEKVGQSIFRQGTITFAQIRRDNYPPQIYYQQELLRKGYTDRLSDINRKFQEKLDDHWKKLVNKLEHIPVEDHQKLKEYYIQFVSTACSLYAASQSVDDPKGRLSLNTDELLWKIIVVGLGYIPFVNNYIVSPIDLFGNVIIDYVKSKAMRNEAKIIKSLAINDLYINDLSSKLALKLVLDKIQQKRIRESERDDKLGMVEAVYAIDTWVDQCKDYATQLEIPQTTDELVETLFIIVKKRTPTSKPRWWHRYFHCWK